MQLLSILVATVWAITAAAQGITIESPPQGKTVHPGNKLTIKVIKNDNIESTIEAGMVIGLLSCPTNNCSPADLGTILYNGPYNPKSNGGPLSESFTVTIPTGFQLGSTQIGFTRFFLIGADNSPTLGAASVTVTVA